MGLKEDIKLQMKEALKASSKNDKEKLRLSTLRFLMAEIENVGIAKKEKLSDEEIIEVISRHIKKRKEAIESYQKAGRSDLVQKEQKEMEILQLYMPPQLSEQEIREVIIKTIEETGASGPKNMGKVMGKAMLCLKGKADGGKVSELVKKLLEEKL